MSDFKSTEKIRFSGFPLCISIEIKYSVSFCHLELNCHLTIQEWVIQNFSSCLTCLLEMKLNIFRFKQKYIISLQRCNVLHSFFVRNFSGGVFFTSLGLWRKVSEVLRILGRYFSCYGFLGSPWKKHLSSTHPLIPSIPDISN